jgi:hypothetical protein
MIKLKPIDGIKTERIFEEIMKKEGRSIRLPSKFQDMFLHIDLFVDDEPYDIKSDKRIARHSTENVVWIEAVNVRGNNGWLYGHAKYIAFRINDEFWVVERLKLLDYVEKNILSDKVFPVKRYKCWYQRRNLRDKVTYIYSRDLEPLVYKKYKIHGEDSKTNNGEHSQ